MGARLIYGEEARLLPWAAARIGITAFREDATAIGQERDGEVAAVVVYDSFSPHDCNMHVASDGSGHWLTRELLAAAFAYPFIQLDKRRVTSPIAANNTRALRFNQRLGFVPEGYHPHGAGEHALVTLGLLRERCRFLPHHFRHLRN